MSGVGELKINRWAYAVIMLCILALSGWLRFAQLDVRPIHADEATGAFILSRQMESAQYTFDPTHFHGPLLTVLAEPACRLKGISGWINMEILPLRQLVAWCGLLTVLGIAFWRLRPGEALLSMIFAGTSPLLVYYSRMFIHEPVILLFSIPALMGVLGLLAGRNRWVSAITFGVGAGGMAATRETVVVSLFAWMLAGILFCIRRRACGNRKEVLLKYLPPLFLSAITVLIIIFIFYTSGGRNPEGFTDFFQTYFKYQTGAGHNKPFGYYFGLLAWPRHSLGRYWFEGGVLLLAGCTYLTRKNEAADWAGRFFFESGLIHLLVYSMVAYKTPWLACMGWFHICVAAGVGGAALLRRFHALWRIAPIALLAAIMGWQGIQSRRAAFRFSWDHRNPYAYVPTLKDAENLPAFLRDLQQRLPESNDKPLAVVGNEYWPLPWYLRGMGEVGYWKTLPEQAQEYPVLLVIPSGPDDSLSKLEKTHTMIPRGLRANVAVVVAVDSDIWEAYLNE